MVGNNNKQQQQQQQQEGKVQYTARVVVHTNISGIESTTAKVRLVKQTATRASIKNKCKRVEPLALDSDLTRRNEILRVLALTARWDR